MVMEQNDSRQIRFMAQVVKVQTMSDGGLRFTFDVSESLTMQAAQLMECHRFGVLLDVVATPVMTDEAVDEKARVVKRSKAKRRK